MKAGIHGFPVPEHTHRTGKERSCRTHTVKCGVGDIFPFQGKQYEVLASGYGCIGCAFDNEEYCLSDNSKLDGLPDCCSSEKSPEGFIIFKLVEGVKE